MYPPYTLGTSYTAHHSSSLQPFLSDYFFKRPNSVQSAVKNARTDESYQKGVESWCWSLLLTVEWQWLCLRRFLWNKREQKGRCFVGGTSPFVIYTSEWDNRNSYTTVRILPNTPEHGFLWKWRSCINRHFGQPRFTLCMYDVMPEYARLLS